MNKHHIKQVYPKYLKLVLGWNMTARSEVFLTLLLQFSSLSLVPEFPPHDWTTLCKSLGNRSKCSFRWMRFICKLYERGALLLVVGEASFLAHCTNRYCVLFDLYSGPERTLSNCEFLYFDIFILWYFCTFIIFYIISLFLYNWYFYTFIYFVLL